MPYNFVAESFHTKKLCSRLHSNEVLFYVENGRFAVLSSLWGPYGQCRMFILGSTGKQVVDFLLVLTELLSLGVMAEALQANIN